MVTKSEEYRLKARECEERADRTRDPFIKQQLIDLAKHWRTLADYPEKHTRYGPWLDASGRPHARMDVISERFR